MLKINKKVEYALIVLKHILNQQDAHLSTAREISDRYKTPFDTTSKVMQQMNNSGILASIQGVKGGYKLAHDLKSLSYLQLVELIEGRKAKTSCKSGKCSLLDSCNIIGPIEKLNEYLIYFFQGLSIHELLDEAPGPFVFLKQTVSNQTQINNTGENI